MCAAAAFRSLLNDAPRRALLDCRLMGASYRLCILQGWRFAFYAVAVVSAAAAAAILVLGTDPAPRRPAAASGKVLRLHAFIYG